MKNEKLRNVYVILDESMKAVLLIIQMVLALTLMATILLQAKGTGLGSAWGGSGESYRSKRGVERILMIATIVLTALFLILALINLAI